METFSASLALCAGNSPVTGERPVTQSFDVFFDLRLNKWLSKRSLGWWFKMSSCSLWCHCNDKYIHHWTRWPLVQHILFYYLNQFRFIVNCAFRNKLWKISTSDDVPYHFVMWTGMDHLTLKSMITQKTYFLWGQFHQPHSYHIHIFFITIWNAQCVQWIYVNFIE